jgi:plastocyanin
MNKLTRLLVLPAFAATLQLAVAGDVTGKITLKGTPPAEAELTMDPACGNARGERTIKSRHYAVGKDNGLADVFVYVKSGLSSKPAPAAAPAVLDQKGCEYIPYVIGAQTGQTIAVKNSDPLLHNVHPVPTVAGNKEYNQAQIPKGPDLKFSWDKPEIFIRFKCDVHPWMFAYVGLVDHPYHAVTDANGNFTIKGLPPGEYEIVAVHRKTHAPAYAGEVQKVKVSADGAKVNYVIEVN